MPEAIEADKADVSSNDKQSPPLWQVPRIDESNRLLGGVATAIATEIGVQPIVIQASFVVLVAAGGWGLILYVAAWFVLNSQPQDAPYERPTPKAASSTHRHMGIGLVVLGLLMAFRLISFGFVDRIVWPIGFVFVGALIAWSQSRDNTEGMSTVARIVAGVAVGVGGLLAFGAFSFNPADGLLALVLALSIVAGVAVIAAPSIMRIGTALDDERNERVRADEKARMAAHLHDSVLQTLSLIQRHAENPTVTGQLARRQERELRSWLYGPATPAGSVRFSSALQDMATAVESDHGVPIEVVVVGDVAMEITADETFEALIGACREAATNASKHSGAQRIDIFAEVSDGQVEVFVRDTGKGFDPGEVDDDRRGIAESIKARMARHGGTASVHTALGEGTEVEISVGLSGSDGVDVADDGSAAGVSDTGVPTGHDVKETI